MRQEIRLAIFLGLAGWPLTASAQQGAAPAPIVCAGTPQAAAQAAAAAQNPGRGGRGPAPAPPTGVAPPSPVVTITAIPGVIASGVKWVQIWEALGNNADGIVADKDGNVYIAQEDNSAGIKIDKNDKASVFIDNTQGGGSFAIDSKGRILSVRRMAGPGSPRAGTPNAAPTGGLIEIAPQLRVFADTAADGSKWTGGPGDLVADNRGGAYFGQGCVHYAAPDGKISLAAEDLRVNGIALSPDYKTLYVTHSPTAGGPGLNRPGDAPSTIVAFDVQPDGTLKNRRTFAELRDGRGDGSAVDTTGRLYVSVGATIQVFAPDGKFLGSIPTPGGVISVAFGGPNHKTLYAVVNAANGIDGPIEGVQRTMRVFRIPTLAEGLKNRGK